MKKKNEWNIEGFRFDTEDAYNRAKAEINGTEYIEASLDKSNVVQMAAAYKGIIEKEVFVTPVGLNYLNNLRNEIISLGGNSDELPLIDVLSKEESWKVISASKEKIYDKLFKSVVLNIILIVTIVLLIVMCFYTKNLNIINYKNRLDREYQAKIEALNGDVP